MPEEQDKKQVPPKAEQGIEELSEDDLEGISGGSVPGSDESGYEPKPHF